MIAIIIFLFTSFVFSRPSLLKVDHFTYSKKIGRIRKEFARSPVIKTILDMALSTLTRSRKPLSRAGLFFIFRRLSVSTEKCFFTQPRSCSQTPLASSASSSSLECSFTKLLQPKPTRRLNQKFLSLSSLLHHHRPLLLFWVLVLKEMSYV